MTDIAALTRLIEPVVEAEGFRLVRVKMLGGDERALQIMAERPETGQLTIEDCVALSHGLSDMLDAEDPIEEAYRLEVSSPGIDRPLTRLSDFADWKGHEARVNLTAKVDGRKQLTGTLLGIEGETVRIDDRKSGELEFAFSDLHSAKLILTDRLIAASAPVDPAGADDIETELETEEQED